MSITVVRVRVQSETKIWIKLRLTCISPHPHQTLLLNVLDALNLSCNQAMISPPKQEVSIQTSPVWTNLIPINRLKPSFLKFPSKVNRNLCNSSYQYQHNSHHKHSRNIQHGNTNSILVICWTSLLPYIVVINIIKTYGEMSWLILTETLRSKRPTLTLNYIRRLDRRAPLHPRPLSEGAQCLTRLVWGLTLVRLVAVISNLRAIVTNS